MENEAQELLQKVLVLVETGIDLKERCLAAEKYVIHLKHLINQATGAVDILHQTSKHTLQHAKKLLNCSKMTLSPLKSDHEKLLAMIDNHLSDFTIGNLGDEYESETLDVAYISEKIKYLETKHQTANTLLPTGSNKSVNVDEKYPENWSKDSSIDLNSVVNLPSVPEDVFTTFKTNKPKRSSSLSSLKSMRKVKLCLQRAETSDDDDISSEEDHDLTHKGDSGGATSPKQHLGNITEETN